MYSVEQKLRNEILKLDLKLVLSESRVNDRFETVSAAKIFDIKKNLYYIEESHKKYRNILGENRPSSIKILVGEFENAIRINVEFLVKEFLDSVCGRKERLCLLNLTDYIDEVNDRLKKIVDLEENPLN